ncbi:MAG: ATP-binding protein [Dehalococcoidia bacterium]
MPDLYIGKTFNAADKSFGDRFLLDSSDLTTHGIVIGMTGSGKTGLSIGLIEELLKNKIPVIVIDPKGDMGNLALAFDRLAPEQFEPWIDKDEAAREGKTTAQVAADAASLWTKGLADSGITAADVAVYAAGHRLRVFTPGATAGIPLNLIDSLAAPGGDFEANEEEYRDEIDSIVTALLGFVKVDADPVSSREYILLFSLVENAWRQGKGLDLESLIGQVANPPIEKVGALPMDSFYPAKDRNGLMFALNNLVASPRFEVWRQGEAIDIEGWVRSRDGVPQLSIVYTSHLDDEERTFVTALILNKLKSWMRKQPGTSELRCLFYMDEIYGYFPPTANPPTKKPLLTLLKQARAYGVGILLSTQNPVDLDYKGLANMGFWAIGRLQTEQDQDRVKAGIEGALANVPGGASFDELIAGVQKRVFLIHNIHRKAPQLVGSRFAMSYLRGPITRDEIKRLGPAVVSWQASAATPAATVGAAPAAATAPPPASGPPPLPSPLKSRYFRKYGGQVANPSVFVKAAVRYKAGGVATDEETHTLSFVMTPDMAVGELLESDPIVIDESAVEEAAPAGISYGELPSFLGKDGARAIERVLRDRLDDRFQRELLYDPVTKKFAQADENEFAFATRLGQTPGADSKRAALELRLDKKRADLGMKQREAAGRKTEKWASLGTSLLSNIGLFTGRKRTVTGLGGVLSKNRMENTSEARAAQLQQEVAALEAQLSELGRIDPSRFERRVVKPAKTDVSIIRFDIVWIY